MNNSFHQDMLVQDVVRDHHGGACIFRRLGMDPNDTCTLTEAVLKKGLSIEFLMAILNKTIAETEVIEQGSGRSFQATLLNAIIEYIVEHHHALLRSELPRLEQLLDKVIETHHRNHASMLRALKAVFLSLKTNIEEHLGIEEEILFPRLRNIERYSVGGESPVEAPERSSPINAVREMKHEHDLVDWGLNEMRALTCDYTPPTDASDALTMLYEGLIKVEVDLQEHFHLENDLLWPVRSPKQDPVDVTIPTDKGAAAEHEDDLMCPRTNQPCEEGSSASCGSFWDCVSDAMQQRWAKANEGDNDG